MKSLAFVALAPLILASPLGQTAQEIQVTLHFSKETSQSSITAWTKDRSAIVGHSCSSTLASGAFEAHPITFKVNENGVGDVVLGGQSSKVQDNPEGSAEVTCGRMHSPYETVVNCDITIPGTLELAAISRRDVPECFTTPTTSLSEVLDGFHQAPAVIPTEQPIEVAAVNATDNELEERQICGVHSSFSVRVGDGNPHQNPMNVQLSENMDCSRDGCIISRSESRSLSVSWSASGTAWSWLNAGFAVEASIETGNDYQCPGNAGDFFCLWKNQAQTAYTVRNRQVTCAGARDVGDNFVMWSPNSQNRGGYYYCVYGRNYCRALGDRWLDTNGRAGGP
ncbi:hypothetical protein JX265_001944 [Neoarthrinium moseri]|uniref:Uncharacterized protein n=1 Tax=Neoarthrinium moseri TaxID=1658444 RepID=A0A9Q0AV31_9PEZI|nr:hypothetical protein JX265_001944 [Neoarthrinium moseri]